MSGCFGGEEELRCRLGDNRVAVGLETHDAGFGCRLSFLNVAIADWHHSTGYPINQRLNAAVNQALGEPAIAGRIRELGASVRITTPAEMLAFIRSEREEYGRIARSGAIRVE